VSSPIARSVSYFTSHSTAGLGAFYVNIDHIGMGCLLAFRRKRLHTVETYMRVLQSKLFLLVPAFILWATCQGNHPSIHRTVLLFLINVSIALCIDWAITNHASVVGRELNRRWIVWIGTLSYSLYLWQQPFLHFNSNIPALNFPPMNPVLALACVLGCACLSYYLVEQPGLWLRDKLNKAWAIRAASVS